MASGRKGKVQKVRRSKADAGGGHRQRRQRLVAHPLFAVGVGLWGALLGGLVVLVVPEAQIEGVTAGSMIATFGVPVKPLLAGGLALLLGLATFGFAAARSSAARRQMNPSTILHAVARKVSPIDPARDLGSKSIDDPIETMPFASPAWRDADIDAAEEDEAAEEDQPLPRFMRARRPEVEPDIEDADEDETGFTPPPPAWREAAPVTEPERPLPRFMTHPLPEAAEAAAPAPAPALRAEPEDMPLELDLASFAQLPGRNAVWVEEPAPVAVAAPAPVVAPVLKSAPKPVPAPAARRAVPTPPPVPGTAALSRLRAVPANELSIPQMVERFAGALHEHRANAAARSLTADELAARETALAEALKALAVLSGVPAAPVPAPADREAPLRAALTQLHPRRGAA